MDYFAYWKYVLNSLSLSLSDRQVIKSLDYAGAEPSTPKCSASNDDLQIHVSLRRT